MTKFMRFVSFISFIMVFSATAETAVWQDLIVHDCNRGLHFLPSSPMGGSFDATPVLTVLDTVVKQVKERIGCTDTTKATKSNALCRYLPSVEMALYNFGQHYNKTDHQKMTDAYDGFPRYGFFDNSFPAARDYQGLGMALLGGILPAGVKYDVEAIMPSTCDPLAYLKGQPCNVELDFFEALGMKIGLSVQQCQKSDAYAPFFSVSCQGENCNKIFLPCLSDNECGSQAKCMDLWKDLFRTEPPIDKNASCCIETEYRYNDKDERYDEDWVKKLEDSEAETETGCLGKNKDGSGNVMDHRKPSDSPTEDHRYTVSSWTNGYVCYGQRSSVIDEDILHFLKNVGLIPEAELNQLQTISKDKCQVDNDSSNLSFAWRWIYKVQLFIRKTLFKVNDAFQPQNDGEFKFCMPNMVAANKTKWGEQFGKLYFEDKFDTVKAESQESVRQKHPNNSSRWNEVGLWRFFKKCQTASGGICREFYDVGNFVCNPSCNIKECHWDGGDCDMVDGRKINAITKDTDKQTYKAFVLDVSREKICKTWEEEKDVDGETTREWKEECEVVDDKESSPLEYVKRDDDQLRQYKDSWREAHRKCSQLYGPYNNDEDGHEKCCIGSSSRQNAEVWWVGGTKNQNITCPFMMNDFDGVDTGDCPGKDQAGASGEANCRDPYGYCKCMSVGTFKRNGDNYFTASTMKQSLYVNIDRYDGNGICEAFTAFVCQMPYCDPADPSWDTKTVTDAKDTRSWSGGKGLTPPIRNNEGLDDKDPRKPVAYAGYWQQISEKDLGSSDCGTDSYPTTESLYPPFHGGETGFYELAIGGGDWDPGAREDSEMHLITKNGPSFIKAWDGKLDDGSIVNAELKKAGLLYKRPSKTTLFKGSKGRTMMRMDCDGTMGFGIGNGLEFLGRWSLLHPLTTFIDDAIKYVQKCRHELHGLTFNEDVYRVNWQIWHPESMLYKVSQSGDDGSRPSLAGVEAMYDKSGHEPFNLHNFGSAKKFQDNAFKEGGDLPVEVCTESCRYQDNWRIQMPDTCTYELYKDKGLCKMKFSGLAEFFNVDNFDMLMEFRRCAAPNAGGLFSGAMVMTGPIPTTLSPLQWCSSNSDCKTGNVCMDLTQKINILGDIYGKLPRTVKTKVYTTSTATIMSDRILEDPFSALVYGQKQANPSCVKPDGTFVAARQVLRALGQMSDDGKKELKFCIPNFFDRLANGDDITEDFNKFIKNRVSVKNNGFTVRDLSKNFEATYMYGTNNLKITGTTASIAADEGKVWQQLEVHLGGGSADVTCQQTEQARDAFMKQMKDTDENTFKDLSQNDVLVTCKANTITTTKQAASGKKWQTVTVEVGKGSADVTCKQTSKARDAFMKQLKEKDANEFSDLQASSVHVSCTETTEKRVEQTLEFSGLTKANVESKKTEITKDIADSLSVEETSVTITSIEEKVGRRRRLLESKKIVIDYDVEVPDEAAASALETKMTSGTVMDTVVDKVATSTSVNKANIQVEQEAPVTKAAGVKLAVAVLVDETTATATKTKLETALGDKASVAEKLADEGVETEKNSVVAASDIEEVEAAETTTDTVEVTESAVVMEVQVQVEESTAQATQDKLEEAFNDKEKVAEKLGEAGVVKEDGSPITTTDVKDTTVADEVKKDVSVSVDELPGNVQDLIAEEAEYAEFTESVSSGSSSGSSSPSPSGIDDADMDELDTGFSVTKHCIYLSLYCVLVITNAILHL
jgi:hypothetical protein